MYSKRIRKRLNKYCYRNSSGGKQQSIKIISGRKAGKNDSIKVDKKLTLNIESLEGKANFYIDEEDKTKIHVNYWLNDNVVVPAGKKIKIIERTLECDTSYSESIKSQILNESTFYNLWRCEVWEIKEQPDFYKNSNKVIEVFKYDGKTIDYYLVNKYDRNADYVLELKNREFIEFKETGWEFGAVTIPLKMRPGYTKNNISVDQEIEGDLNLGIFSSYKIGKYRARYERHQGFVKLANVSLNVGPFFSLGTVDLDKNNTTVSSDPIMDDSTKSIGYFSTGGGLMVSIYNFRVGAYLGWDFGFGTKNNSWNYDNRPWFGLGVSYSIKNPWKESE